MPLSDIYIYARPDSGDANPEMYLVKEDSSAPYGYGIEPVSEYFGKIFPGDYLLIQDDALYVHELVKAETTHDELVERAKEVLSTPAVYVRTAEYDGERKIAIYFKRKELNDLFKEFAFGKIMTLDVFLWKVLRSKGYDQGIVGILTERFAYARNTKRETFEELAFKKDSALRVADREIWRDVIRAEAVEKYPKAFITDVNLSEFFGVSEEEMAALKIETVSYKEIRDIVVSDIESSVLDTVSDNYNAKIYRLVLNLGAGVLILAAAYMSYQWFVNKSKNVFYEMKIEKLEKKLSGIEKENSKLKKSIIYDKYAPFDYTDFLSRLAPIKSLGDAVTASSYEIDSKGKLRAVLRIKGIESVKKLVKSLHGNRVTVKKAGKDVFTTSYEEGAKRRKR